MTKYFHFVVSGAHGFNELNASLHFFLVGERLVVQVWYLDVPKAPKVVKRLQQAAHQQIFIIVGRRDWRGGQRIKEGRNRFALDKGATQNILHGDVDNVLIASILTMKI